MRPRGIPAENIAQARYRLSRSARHSFNEAAGNTRGKLARTDMDRSYPGADASMRPRGIPAENKTKGAAHVLINTTRSASMRPRGIPAENVAPSRSAPYVEQQQVASMRPRGIPAENAKNTSCTVVAFYRIASMRPRGIPAENAYSLRTSASVPNLRFNEAAGNTRGKPDRPGSSNRPAGFNEAAGNTRGKPGHGARTDQASGSTPLQ